MVWISGCKKESSQRQFQFFLAQATRMEVSFAEIKMTAERGVFREEMKCSLGDVRFEMFIRPPSESDNQTIRCKREVRRKVLGDDI